MANYSVLECSTGQEYIVSAVTMLSTNEVISFNTINSEDSYICGTVQSTSSLEATHLRISSYETCCDCIETNIDNGYYVSFEFQSCTGNTIDISILDFCTVYGTNPNIGEYFRLFNTGTSESICGVIAKLSQITPSTGWIPDEGPYSNCSDCEPDIPRSAGTETFVCEVCCPCESGSTFTIIPPHPVWTDGYGTSVTQLNAITLGGMFGLNS